MKKLFVIRHAKSSWKDPQLRDHDRPLNKRGERDSLIMAHYLQDLCEQGDGFDVIYSSTAQRALQLAQTISDDCQIKLISKSSLYTFDVDQLWKVVTHLPDQINRVAVVGHNPAITFLVNSLVASELANVPTSGVAQITAPVEYWHQLTQHCAELTSLMTPKMRLERF